MRRYNALRAERARVRVGERGTFSASLSRRLNSVDVRRSRQPQRTREEQNRLCSRAILFLKTRQARWCVGRLSTSGYRTGRGRGKRAPAGPPPCVEWNAGPRDAWGAGCSDPDRWGPHRSTRVFPLTEERSELKPTAPCINLTDTFRNCAEKPDAGGGRAGGWPGVTSGHGCIA